VGKFVVTGFLSLLDHDKDVIFRDLIGMVPVPEMLGNPSML